MRIRAEQSIAELQSDVSLVVRGEDAQVEGYDGEHAPNDVDDPPDAVLHVVDVPRDQRVREDGPQVQAEAPQREEHRDELEDLRVHVHAGQQRHDQNEVDGGHYEAYRREDDHPDWPLVELAELGVVWWTNFVSAGSCGRLISVRVGVDIVEVDVGLGVFPACLGELHDRADLHAHRLDGEPVVAQRDVGLDIPGAGGDCGVQPVAEVGRPQEDHREDDDDDVSDAYDPSFPCHYLVKSFVWIYT